MSSMDLDEVEPDLLATFNGCNESVFDALYIVLGHRDGLRVTQGEGYVARTVNYSVSGTNENLVGGRGRATNHCSASRPHPQVPAVWGL